MPVNRIPLTDLFSTPKYLCPQVSPDGTLLAYLATSAGVLNVWIKPLHAGIAEQITFSPVSLHEFHWLPDGSGIMFLHDVDGDENYQIHCVTLADRQMSSIVALPGVKASVLRVDYRHPDSIIVSMNKRDAAFFDVFRYLVKEQTLECLHENLGGIATWYVDHTMEPRIGKRIADDGGTELLVLADGRYRTLLRGAVDDVLEPLEILADGQVLLASSLESNTAELVRLDPASGMMQTLYHDEYNDVVAALCSADGAYVLAAGAQAARLSWIPLTGGEYEHMAMLSSTLHGDWRLISRDRDDRTWILSLVRDIAPIEFYLYDRKSNRVELLFRSQPVLEQYAFTEMEPVSFPARDGLMLHGYLSRATPHHGGIAPLILLVHGGPWARDSWEFQTEVQWLTNRGYSVLQVNFRGSTGYGKDHLSAANHEWGGKMHLDIIDAKHWAVAQGIAEAHTCGIYGFSYGGYEVLVALTLSPDEFRCGIALSPPSSLITLLEAMPPYWKPILSMLKSRVGDLQTERDFLAKRSPISHVDAIRSPLFIAQGVNDPRVKLQEAERMVRRMQSEQKTVELLVFPDEGHGITKEANRIRFYEEAERFLAAYVGADSGELVSARAKASTSAVASSSMPSSSRNAR